MAATKSKELQEMEQDLAAYADQLIEDFRERRRNNRQAIAPLLALAEIHRSNGEYEERRQALLEAVASGVDAGKRAASGARDSR